MLTYTIQLFEENSNPEFADKMQQYMRGQFEFYGIKAPIRKALLKKIEAQEGRLQGEELKLFVEAAWDEPYRELQHLAMDRMDKVKRKLDASFLPFIENLIVQKSWWDTVDMLAVNGIGPILARFPEHIPSYNLKWIQSENMWLQRTALIFQLKYKKQTDTDLLFTNILEISHSKEFFLQKAAGWALRQHSKIDADLVRDFIEKNTLMPLTVREGSRYL